MPPKTQAFTRLELLAVLIMLALLAALAVPLLAASRTDANRAVCYNNLRRLGSAIASWSDDRSGRPPWHTPINEGGTLPAAAGKIGTAWVEFLSLSNELAQPRILACPGDIGVKAAEHWGTSSNGFANTGFRLNALSYVIGLHAWTEYPETLLSGDRNFTAIGQSACVHGLFGNAWTWSDGAFYSTWTNGSHYNSGHLLWMDGRVGFTTPQQLYSAVTSMTANNGSNSSIHFLPAR
jgi:type II secretory pathway pseudopilin PulG